MGCTHPLGVDPIRNHAGDVIGVRCHLCKAVAYEGDGIWTTIKRGLGLHVPPPREREA